MIANFMIHEPVWWHTFIYIYICHLPVCLYHQIKIYRLKKQRLRSITIVLRYWIFRRPKRCVQQPTALICCTFHIMMKPILHKCFTGIIILYRVFTKYYFLSTHTMTGPEPGIYFKIFGKTQYLLKTLFKKCSIGG